MNGWTLAIGLGVLAVMFASARLDRRIPGGLIGLVGSTALVAVFGLQAHGVAVLGTIQSGAPHIGLSGLSWSTLGSLAPLAAVVALVVMTQTAATTRAFAEQGGYDADAGRDFFGVGAGSVVAGLVGAFPVDASPPRTGAVATAGGRTQAGRAGGGAGHRPAHPRGECPQGRAAGDAGRRPDLRRDPALQAQATCAPSPASTSSSSGLPPITLLTVVIIGVEQGIGVAVGLAILDRIRLSARPQLHVLGRLPGTTSWAPLSAGLPAVELPGVLVLLFATPLWYANAAHFRDEVVGALGRAPGTRVLVLDALGMSDVDFTGSQALGNVLDSCDRAHVAFGLARAGDHLQDILRAQRSGAAHRGTSLLSERERGGDRPDGRTTPAS